MTTEREGGIWDVVRMALDGSPESEFLVKALEAKRALSETLTDLWREMTLLDNLVASVTPTANWTTGYYQEPPKTVTLVPTQGAVNRNTRVVEIARGILDEGAMTVTSKAVVEVLQNEGDKTAKANLAVSVGNILTRAVGWGRVGPGEYEYDDE